MAGGDEPRHNPRNDLTEEHVNRLHCSASGTLTTSTPSANWRAHPSDTSC